MFFDRLDRFFLLCATNGSSNAEIGGGSAGFGEGEGEIVGFSVEEGIPVWGGERQGFGGGRERGFRGRKSGIHCPGKTREDEG